MPIRSFLPLPFILGIVGHAQDKFTSFTEWKARDRIGNYILTHQPIITKIVSGGCHLGGVDQYAKEISISLSIPFEEYLPKIHKWEGGYKQRNLKIAQAAKVLCIVVADYPNIYAGMKFNGCYHCGNRNPTHVKSGGCWTAWKCKQHEWIII
jgi:hypothetical protein